MLTLKVLTFLKPKNHMIKELESKIYRFIDKAEELINSNNLNLAIRYLCQANNMYNRHGYDFKINCRINEAVFTYDNKYVLPKKA